jgi:hypothetical protein
MLSIFVDIIPPTIAAESIIGMRNGIFSDINSPHIIDFDYSHV